MPPAIEPSTRRRLGAAASWGATAVAVAVLALGLIGPHLGGDGPGPDGVVGFAVEVVAAQWVPFGAVAAIAAATVAWRRRWRAAATLAAAALVVLLPALWRWRSAPAHLRGEGPVLRIATVNLQGENPDNPEMQASLRALDADVLVLPELTFAWQQQMERWFPARGGDYPHRFLADNPRVDGLVTDGLRIAVWSRIAAAGDAETLLLRRHNAQIRVPLLWRGRTFALYGVHPWKPFPYSLFHSAWQERRLVLDWIARERLPIVVAGDLNASARSPFVHRLRALGLTVAAESACGNAPGTWPTRPEWLAPVRVALDHVLCGGAFTAVDAGLGPASGSDHLPLWAELAWRDGD